MKKKAPSLIAILAVLFYVQASPASMSFVESGDAWGLTEPLKGIMADKNSMRGFASSSLSFASGPGSSNI